MRHIFFSAILLLHCANLSAQAPSLYTAFGVGSDAITDTYIDAQGNTISCGYFTDTIDFDPGPGVTNAVATGTSMSLVKLNSSGQLQWVKVFPMTNPSGVATPKEMKTDAAGNIFITGAYTHSMDFDAGPGLLSDTAWCNCISSDFFILKLDPNGNTQWMRSIGALSYDASNSIDVDANGNSYICGSFSNSVDFDPGPGTHYLNGGVNQLFYMKLDANGNFRWAHTIQNGGYQSATSIRLDQGTDKLYVAGKFDGNLMDFDTGPGTHILTSAGFTDAYVLQLDTAGNFNWVYQLGGTNVEEIRSIGVSPDHHVYAIGGMLSDTIDMDAGPGTAMFYQNGAYNGFILKLTSAGNYRWHGSFEGAYPLHDLEAGIAFDSQEQLYMHATFNDTADLDPGPGTSTIIPVNPGQENSYITRLDTANGHLLGMQLFLGTSNYYRVVALDLEIGAGGFPYLSGIFSGTCDFDPDTGAFYSASYNGGPDFFLIHSGLVMDVNENPPVNSVPLYPNPGNGIFTLVLPVGVNQFGRITITDLTGRIVYSENLKSSTAGMQKTIDIQNEAAGMYIMSLEMDHYSVSQKVLISR